MMQVFLKRGQCSSISRFIDGGGRFFRRYIEGVCPSLVRDGARGETMRHA